MMDHKKSIPCQMHRTFTDDMTDDGTPVVKLKHYKAALEPLITGPLLLLKEVGSP